MKWPGILLQFIALCDKPEQQQRRHTLGIECKCYPPGYKECWLGIELVLLLLRRAPRALEGGPSERQHLLGVGREVSERGAELV